MLLTHFSLLDNILFEDLFIPMMNHKVQNFLLDPFSFPSFLSLYSFLKVICVHIA